MKEIQKNTVKDFVLNLFEYYDLPLPHTKDNQFGKPQFSRDVLWSTFIVEYVKKYGSGNDPGSVFVRTVNCMFGDVTIGISDIPDLPEVLVGKVDVVEGHGLSEKDFTSVLKNKLDGIAEGAQVNVQSDYAQTDPIADDYIKNKPVIGHADLCFSTTPNSLEKLEISENLFNANETTDKTLILHDIARTGEYGDLLGKPPINNPTITFQMNSAYVGSFTLNQESNGMVNFSPATSDEDGIMTKEAYSKLAGIAAGAQVNVVPDWLAASESSAFIKNKPSIGNATITVRRMDDAGSSYTALKSFTVNATDPVNIDIPLATSGATGISGLLKNVDKTKIDTVMTQWYGTLAQYNAISTKDPNTEYNIYK